MGKALQTKLLSVTRLKYEKARQSTNHPLLCVIIKTVLDQLSVIGFQYHEVLYVVQSDSELYKNEFYMSRGK